MSTSNTNTSNEEIDVLALLAKLLNKRKFILKFIIVFFIVGIVIVLLTPSSFKASTIFVPQVSSSRQSSSLGGLASLAGINLNMGGSDNNIPPNLYPKIISSLPFKLQLLETEIEWKGEKILYQEYLQEKPRPATRFIKEYTLGLPGKVIGLFKKQPEDYTPPYSPDDSLQISYQQFQCIKLLPDIIQIVVNEKDGSVYLAAIESDPMIAAKIAKRAKDELQETIIEYKVQNTQAFYDYTSEQFFEKQQELYALQDTLADFTESNKSISSAYLENRLRRINARYDMINTVYLELAKQKEQVALQLKKDTPIFSVIEPVSVPLEKSAPKSSLIVIMYTLFGLFVGAAIVLLKAPTIRLLTSLKAQ